MISLIVSVALAAAPITLEEARQQSRTNPRVLQAELDRLRALEQQHVARSALLPQVSLTASPAIARAATQVTQVYVPVLDQSTGNIRNEQRLLETPASTRTSLDLTVNLNQLLYDAGRWARLAQTGAELEAFTGQAYEEVLSSEQEGIRRFYQLYRAQLSLEVFELRVKDDEALLQRATDLVEAGKRSREDVLTARVNLGNDQIQTILLQAQAINAGSELAMWLGRDGTEVLTAVAPGTLEQPPAPPPSLESALAVARENRPLLKAFRARVKVADKSVSIARAGYLPQLGATATYNRNAPTTERFFGDPYQQSTVGANVVLSWNLFSGLLTSAAVRDAKLFREKGEVNLIQYEKELSGEVFQSLILLQAQIAATQVADLNRQQAREGLRAANDLYNAGVLSTLELRDAQVKVTNAELTWIQSRIDVEVARATLERSMGTLSKSTP